MSHSYTNLLVHCVFSTKERRNSLTPDLRQRLMPYLGGIARDNGMNALAIGGVENHAHVLLAIPATVTVASAMQTIKGGSTRWIHDTFREHRGFSWQEGYGAFSIGVSGREGTISYIQNQEEHHRKRTFEEEFTMILDRHGIAYDSRYVFG